MESLGHTRCQFSENDLGCYILKLKALGPSSGPTMMVLIQDDMESRDFISSLGSVEAESRRLGVKGHAPLAE